MKRALLVVIGLLVLLLAAVVALPLVLKDRLVALAVDTLNEQLDATVSVEGADASLLGAFPDLTLTLDGVKVVNRAPFEGVVLADIRALTLTVDLMSALSGGTVEVRSVALDAPTLTLRVDAEGRSNTDIVPESPDSGAEEGGGYALHLERYAITDSALDYQDLEGGLTVSLRGLDHSGAGDFTQDLVALDTETTLAALTVISDETTWLRDTRWVADVALDYDQRTGGVTLKDNHIQVNELTVALSGSATPSDAGWDLDLTLGGVESSFAGLLSLVPQVYAGSLEGLGATGALALSGTVKGLLPSEGDDLPALALSVKVDNASYTTEALPSGVTGITLQAALQQPAGPLDGLVVDIPRFAMTLEGAPLTGRVKLSHLDSDPSIDLATKGRVDLATLRKAMPASEATYSGTLDADVTLAGRVSAFEAQALDKVKADGRFVLTDVTYSEPDLAVPVTIANLDLGLDPRDAALHDLKMRMGASDLQANGTIGNLVPWLLTDAPLTGRLSLTSKVLNLDELSSGDADDSDASAGGSGVVVVPDWLDLVLDAQVGALIYGEQTFEDTKGRIIVKGGQVTVEGLRMTLLNGALALSGSYAAPTAEYADVVMDVDLGRPELAAALSRFEIFRKLAPLARNARGSFRTNLSFSARLGPDLSPDVSSLQSKGRLKTFGVTLEPGFMNQVAEALGNPRFNALVLGDNTLGFQVKDGRTVLDPVTLKLGGQPATLAGSTGVLDQSLNYVLSLKLPTEQLTKTALSGRLGELAGKEADVIVKIGGTPTAPTVKLDLGALTDSLTATARAEVETQVEAVKQQVTETIDAAAQQALDAARAQGDRLVAEAERAAARVRSEGATQAENTRAEAKRQARNLRKEAKGNPIAEAAADKAADKLIAEAETTATRIEREANRQADSLVSEAETQRARLIREAEQKLQR
ncbi:MAG: AsmA family protein [Alphaproteobacteria bacterium]|nr:AsmA family protein [Alphaproteobacteria bacterium]